MKTKKIITALTTLIILSSLIGIAYAASVSIDKITEENSQYKIINVDNTKNEAASLTGDPGLGFNIAGTNRATMLLFGTGIVGFVGVRRKVQE